MVTVVITTCKRSYETLKRAIESVLNQTYTDFELFVVDDSPNDFEERDNIATRLLEWEKEDERIHYIQHDVCKGACAARNTGLKHAHGEFIAFLDDDDEWMPSKLECQLSVFENGDKDLGLVYCEHVIIHDENGGEDTPKKLFKLFKNGYVYDSLILYNYVGSTSFPLIRTSSLIDVGGFDEQMQSCQDYDAWLRLAQKYKFDYIPKPLVRYHTHIGESIIKNPEKRLNGHLRLNEKNAEYIANNRKAAWARNYVLIRMYSHSKQTKKAFKTLGFVIRKGPHHVLKNTKAFLGIFKDIIKSKHSKTKK